MGVVRVNPTAEAGTEFPVMKPGTYRMRIKAVEDRNNSETPKNDLKVTLEYVDGSQLIQLNGTPFNGKLEAAGSLFDYIGLADDKQWKLRQIAEAAGLGWTDQDFAETLLGCELDVKVKIEEYQGEQKNKVGRYMKPSN